MDTEQSYLLCQFTDGLMIVRSSWLIEVDGIRKCFLPGNKDYVHTIKNTKLPGEKWTSHDVVEILLGSGKFSF